MNLYILFLFFLHLTFLRNLPSSRAALSLHSSIETSIQWSTDRFPREIGQQLNKTSPIESLHTTSLSLNITLSTPNALATISTKLVVGFIYILLVSLPHTPLMTIMIYRVDEADRGGQNLSPLASLSLNKKKTKKTFRRTGNDQQAICVMVFQYSPYFICLLRNQ